MLRTEPLSEYYEDFHRERGKKGTVNISERFHFLRKEVGQNRDVVELGCRYGDLLSHFREGNRVTGCDIDRTALKLCAERFGIPTHLVNLNEPLPFEKASFDVVVLSEVLEHLPYPPLTLTEIVRILRAQGKLVGSVPNGAMLQNRLRFLVTGKVETDRTHLHHFSLESLQVLLGSFFERVRVEPVSGRYRRLWPRMLSNYLLFAAEVPRFAIQGT